MEDKKIGEMSKEEFEQFVGEILDGISPYAPKKKVKYVRKQPNRRH